MALPTSICFYDNFLTSITLLTNIAVTGGAVASSAARVSQIQATRAGGSSATLELAGTYTSTAERHYRVEIHNAGTGAFGSAVWRWSDTGGTTWNASNLNTGTGGAFVALSHGITARFNGGPTNPQFFLNDAWDFYVALEHGPAKAADLSRETEYRSGTVPGSSSIDWQIDLGTALAPTVFALLDENMPANGTVTLKAKTTGFTDPPDYTNVIAPGINGRRMELITPGAFRYWRVTFTFVSAPAQGYLRFSEIFLGATATFAKQFLTGFTDGQRVLATQDLAMLVRGPSPFALEGRYLSLRYPSVRDTDLVLLQALRAWIADRTVRTRRPFYFVRLDTQLNDFGLFQWANDFNLEHRQIFTYGVAMELSEVIRTFD